MQFSVKLPKNSTSVCKHRLLVLAAIWMTALCACARNTQNPTGNKLTIAVIPKGTSHVFWQSVHAGAQKAATELGVDLVWRGPLREDDRDSQVSEVEGFVSRGISGIVLAPLDETALVTPVSNATRNKIPVVIFDSGLKSDDYVSFVATDNLKGGRLAGEHMAKLLGGKGKVVLLRYAEGSNSTSLREQGFLDVMKENPGIEVVSSNQYAGADVEGAYKKSEALLSRFKAADGSPSINGVFCPNESTTLGMLRAFEDNGWAGKLHFVGFDASSILVKGVRDGHIDALVLQDPIKMGYLGVKTMVAHLRGENVDKRIDTGVTLVTHDNLDQPAMKDLVEPDLTKWLKQ
jgi:ribose transport system substrate-binding protein